MSTSLPNTAAQKQSFGDGFSHGRVGCSFSRSKRWHILTVLKRNRSLTRVEIDAYWNSKKKTEEDHLKHIYSLTEDNQVNASLTAQEHYQRSKSFPPAYVAEPGDGSGTHPLSTLEENLKKHNLNDWWTRSTWAFLNEPPVTAMEAPSYKYASQNHVANFLKSEPGTSAA